MAKIEVEKDSNGKSTWKYVLIGLLVVGVIVLLYYGFFLGENEAVEGVEDPAVIEQGISQSLKPFLIEELSEKRAANV
ncbi:hypothetical protein [Nafulsella turpanensis]|uniref:hypothetical protein n=1 Tax=Nafulsella turpanensis TaxID=1265690 RepID=UPI00034CF798|nr:hypothetical protein [Nafulsella turpanensis]